MPAPTPSGGWFTSRWIGARPTPCTPCAVHPQHWELGGEGAEALAQVVIEAAEEKPHFKFLYQDTEPLKAEIEKIAPQVYGAGGVTHSPVANQKIKKVEAEAELKTMGTGMVKTRLGLSHDPTVEGRPKGWTLPISYVLTFRGAGFVVPVAGASSSCPARRPTPRFGAWTWTPRRARWWGCSRERLSLTHPAGWPQGLPGRLCFARPEPDHPRQRRLDFLRREARRI